MDIGEKVRHCASDQDARTAPQSWGREAPETGTIQTAHEFAMSFFGYLKRKVFGSRSDLFEDRGPLSIGGAPKSLAAEDAESFARGELPEARLIPHHAIKRDVIVAAYTKDFDTALRQVSSMGWTETEKQRQIAQMKADFEKHIRGEEATVA
jgi:hypothetical protein